MFIAAAEADNEFDNDEIDYLLDEHDELEKWFLNIMVEPEYVNFPKCEK